ncbi:unnamed protein product [Sphagnum balticum]
MYASHALYTLPNVPVCDRFYAFADSRVPPASVAHRRMASAHLVRLCAPARTLHHTYKSVHSSRNRASRVAHRVALTNVQLDTSAHRYEYEYGRVRRRIHTLSCGCTVNNGAVRVLSQRRRQQCHKRRWRWRRWRWRQWPMFGRSFALFARWTADPVSAAAKRRTMPQWLCVSPVNNRQLHVLRRWWLLWTVVVLEWRHAVDEFALVYMKIQSTLFYLFMQHKNCAYSNRET